MAGRVFSSPCFVLTPVRSFPSTRPFSRRCRVPQCSASASPSARVALKSLIESGRAASSPQIQSEIANTVSRLLEEETEDHGSGDWTKDIIGRWALCLSTEVPLVRLISSENKFLGVGAVYQVVKEGNTLDNVIQFKRKDSNFEICVGVDYETIQDDDNRIVRFVFRKTTLKFPGVPRFTIPFAVGRGEFRCVWLDQMRIDYCDLPSGERWINVYSYDGPVVPCEAV